MTNLRNKSVISYTLHMFFLASKCHYIVSFASLELSEVCFKTKQ